MDWNLDTFSPENKAFPKNWRNILISVPPLYKTGRSLSRDDFKMEEGWHLDAFDDGSLSELVPRLNRRITFNSLLIKS